MVWSGKSFIPRSILFLIMLLHNLSRFVLYGVLKTTECVVVRPRFRKQHSGVTKTSISMNMRQTVAVVPALVSMLLRIFCVHKIRDVMYFSGESVKVISANIV